MFRYISEIIAQFSTPQKVIALSLILLSIVIITIAPSLIENKGELKEEIVEKNNKIKALESEINEKDIILRKEQKSCTNEILEREKEFITMLDYLRDKAKSQNNKITSNTNKETFIIKDSLSTNSAKHSHTSTIIVKNDMNSIISEIDEIKKKVKH